MIVMKFGGSSLRTVESLQRVIKIIKRDESSQKIIILSAVNGVTDHLHKSINDALQNEKQIPGLIDYLHLLHKELVVGSIGTVQSKIRAMEQIECLLSRLKKLLVGISYTGVCPATIREQIISMGERMAVSLLAECLQSHGVDARAFEADRIDLFATGQWGYGNADLEKTHSTLLPHLEPVLQKGTIPVITGYFGCTSKGETITFGRGGTDYSAAVIAHVVDAEQLQVWKDVDGFLTASPEIVSRPKPIDYLSYDEAAELAYFGAKILHPRTVEPLHKKNIPIIVKNTYHPEAQGTEIGPERHVQDGVLKSVTYNRNLGILKFVGAGLGCQPGFLKEITVALHANHINIRSIVTSQTAVSLLLDQKDLSESARCVQILDLPYVESIEQFSDIAVVAVVGEGIADTIGLSARVLSSVAAADINVEMISSGASTVAYYFIVRDRVLYKAVQAIHTEFFQEESIHAVA